MFVKSFRISTVALSRVHYPQVIMFVYVSGILLLLINNNCCALPHTSGGSDEGQDWELTKVCGCSQYKKNISVMVNKSV